MFNHHEMTKKCIDSVIAKAGLDVEILVVDNGSEIKFVDSRVAVLRIDKNCGFTQAVNEGILFCKDDFDYVHFLNNDTEATEGFIKHLLDAMEANPGVGIAASSRIMKNQEGKEYIENIGADILTGYQVVTNIHMTEDIIYCDWVPLCSALIRMEMIRYIGLLDRRMYMYCSDNDYCIRANQFGWNVAMIPKSTVYHHHSGTIKNSIDPSKDRQVLLEKIGNKYYAEVMGRLPLDGGNKVWGRLILETYTK